MSRAALQNPHRRLVSANRGIPPTAGALDNGGQPPHDGDMEQRVTRLEVIAEDLRNDVHDIRQDLRETRQEFRKEMSEMRQEFRKEMSEMRAEFLDGFKSVRTNIWLAAISAIGISVGAMYGIVQTTLASIDAGRASASVQHTSTPPIIINVPPPAAPSEPPAKP